jgi:hypothetical protein
MIWLQDTASAAPSQPVPAESAAAPSSTWAFMRQSLSWSRIDAAVPKGLSGDLGVILRRRPEHIGADKPTVELYPIIELKVGDRWQISLDDGIKWAAARVGRWRVGPVLEYRESFRDELPPGAHRMPDAFEFGGFSQWQTGLGDIEVRLRHALNSYQGWSGDVSYDTGVRLSGVTALGVELRGAWADADFSDEFFGLRPRHADSLGLPRVLKNSYITFGSEVTLGHKIDARTTVFIQGSADRIYGEEWRSPILKSRNIFILSIGMARHFGVRDAESLL